MQRALNILGWIGTVVVFVAVAVRFANPDWDQYAVYGAWAGLALVVLYTLGQWREIAAYFKQRNAQRTALAGVSVLVVLGLLIAVNYLAARRAKRWDLTANKQYTLSDQSVKILQDLDAPVKILVFDREAEFDRYRTRLAEYEYQSGGKVDVEYIDADRRPVEARQYEIQTYGTIVVEYMGRREKVTSDTEQDVTNGLIKVLNPQQRKVYFLAGHGEKDPSITDRGGFSTIADALRSDNYEFDKLVLAQTNEIPADATALVIAGPKTDILEQEATLIREYLGKSGKLLVMLDPPDDLKTNVPMPQLTGLLKEWGINATNTVVVDLSGRTTVATIPVAAPPYPGHAITDQFGLITMFPVVRAMTPDTTQANRPAQSFIQTAARSWAETTLAQLQNPDSLAPETDKGDITGPVSIGVAVAVPAITEQAATPAAQQGEDQPKPEARVAAIGDSDFASNAYLGIEGNRDLFMNTVNWVAQQENLIAIRPRDPSDSRLTLTANARQGLFWLSIVVIPLAVLGAGIFAWWRRR